MSFKLTKDFLESVNEAIEQRNFAWFKQNVFDLHDADVAAIIDELDEDEAAYLYGLLNENMQADVLIELDEDTRDAILGAFSTKEFA
ncbi:magnesium transporter, partial [Crocinitomicaceae bacterium]|nr:magnesium transporter [Crocinitomicaceae bacterium]MDC1385647.1 magnesium transporter [Crocinitomicaceae bacterium]